MLAHVRGGGEDVNEGLFGEDYSRQVTVLLDWTTVSRVNAKEQMVN